MSFKPFLTLFLPKFLTEQANMASLPAGNVTLFMVPINSGSGSNCIFGSKESKQSERIFKTFRDQFKSEKSRVLELKNIFSAHVWRYDVRGVAIG